MVLSGSPFVWPPRSQTLLFLQYIDAFFLFWRHFNSLKDSTFIGSNESLVTRNEVAIAEVRVIPTIFPNVRPFPCAEDVRPYFITLGRSFGCLF
ncbi:hypothetical protein NPIL_382211 [Nephila pilipes]|uniref:Uncharacterized protein n=1 Tax=Nephila pilipes TaxID=299642 RepID=A0A8X6US35_NEPPI|nr:hypothetical protein NPIL_382211 [Nephila pilipes]